MPATIRSLGFLFALGTVLATQHIDEASFELGALDQDSADDALSLLQQGARKNKKNKKSKKAADPAKLHHYSMEQLLAEVESRHNQVDQSQLFQEAKVVAGKKLRVVIVGAGPSGLSAAIYAARAGLKPVVISPFFGGQLMGKGVDIENYAGVWGARTTGVGLVGVMRNQAHTFNTRFINAAVARVNFTAKSLKLYLQGTKKPVRAHAVIVASGTTSRWLHAPNEDKYKGRGVSACATCDGFFFRNMDVIVVGGGDSAMEDVLHLANFAKHITVIHRRDQFRASKIMVERVLHMPKVSVRWNTTVESFLGTDHLTHVMLKNLDGTVEKFATAGAFEAIGQIPQTGFLRSHVDLDHGGYVVLKPGAGTATSVPGVFAAGDVADHLYRQAITASGTGAQAALDAERYLNSGGHP